VRPIRMGACGAQRRRPHTFPSGESVDPDDANIDVTYGRQPLAFETGWGTAGAMCLAHWRYDGLAPDGGPLCNTGPLSATTRGSVVYCDEWLEALSIPSDPIVRVGISSAVDNDVSFCYQDAEP
jgi:hypothetical protein